MTGRVPDEEANAWRIAPNTRVMWFKGMTTMEGRVAANIPGPKGRPGTILIKGTDGKRHIIPAAKVLIRKQCDD